jgi:hypothetical protein
MAAYMFIHHTVDTTLHEGYNSFIHKTLPPNMTSYSAIARGGKEQKL